MNLGRCAAALQSFGIAQATSAFVYSLILLPSSVCTHLYSFVFVAVHFPAQPLEERTRPRHSRFAATLESSASKSHLIPCHCLLSTGAYFPCFVIFSSFWYLSLKGDTCMSSYDIRVFGPLTSTYYFALPYFSSLQRLGTI